MKEGPLEGEVEGAVGLPGREDVVEADHMVPFQGAACLHTHALGGPF